MFTCRVSPDLELSPGSLAFASSPLLPTSALLEVVYGRYIYTSWLTCSSHCCQLSIRGLGHLVEITSRLTQVAIAIRQLCTESLQGGVLPRAFRL